MSDLRGSWLSSAVDQVGGQTQREGEEAAALYVAMARQRQAEGEAELARWSGLPRETVRRNADEVSRAQRVERDVGIISTQPSLQRWLVSNPDNAVAAQNDVGSLGAVSTWFGPSAGRAAFEMDHPGAVYVPRPELLRRRTWPEILDSARSATRVEGARQQAIEANRPDPTPYSVFRGISVDTAEGLRQTYLGAMAYMADAVGASDYGREHYVDAISRSQERALAFRPQMGTGFGSTLYGGVTSLLQTVPALLAAPFTDGASLAVLFGAQTGAQAYGKYRARGGTANEALVGGGLEGAIESVTEVLPLTFLVSRFGKRGTAGFIGGFLGREMLGEQFATLGQDAVDTAIANPTATWDQYWADRPRAAFDTAVATVIAGGAIGGAHHLFRNISAAANDLDAATTALAGAGFLDQAVALAENSQLHKQDPQGFRDYVQAQAQGTPLENVYVPAEAVRSLFQSEGRDYHADPFWGGYASQIDEASAIGGDVVIPIGDAVTGFANNSHWDTLRDSVRLSPGGISLAEARSIAQSYQDLMEQRGQDVAREVAASTEAQAPVRRVYEDVLQQARSAGFSLNAARSYADLFAARAAARAEQRGTDAWTIYRESLGAISSEAPASLRPYEAADQLDVLVNAMRRGQAAPSDRAVSGPSLLEFVADRGGVTDPNGDLAAMGADQWHRAQAFRKRLVLPTEGADVLPGMEAQGNANSPDATAQAAWEAGYFPNATERPTVDEFLQAVDRELRGSPVYASHEGGRSESEADVAIRNAAEDLRGFLENRGLDADTASVAEIREAIAEHETESARGFEQWRNWNEPPPGVVPDLILHHNGPADLPRGKPSGPSYFGTVDFSESTGKEFGDWRYTYWVPEGVAAKIATLEPTDAHGREVAHAIAEAQFPNEPEYAQALLDGDEDAWLDFYETWADSSNLAPTLEARGLLGARHKAETMLLPEGVAQLVDRRSGPDDGTISFYQTQVEHPPFFSALRRAAEAAGTAKAPAAQWLATFRNAPGVKAEEIEWSGLEEWLAEQPGPVSRTDVQEFLKAGGISVDEVVLGEFDSRAIAQLTDKLIDEAVAKRAREILDEEDPWSEGAADNIEAVSEVEEDGEVVAWEFDGVEYESESAAEEARDEAVARAEQAADADQLAQVEDAVRSKIDEDVFHEKAIEQLGALGHYPDWTSAGERDAAQAANYRELLITLPLGQGRNPRSAPDTHWQQPGVVAHLRFLTRRGLDGRPVMFIEEVQSDWHQKGRDEGYAKPATAAEILAAQAALQDARSAKLLAWEDAIALARELGAFPTEDGNYAGWWADLRNAPLEEQANQAVRRLVLLQSSLAAGEPRQPATSAVRGRLTALGEAARISEVLAKVKASSLRVEETSQAYGRATSTAGIPEAPFKTTWPALVMKRAIRWAADNGFTRVAWTTGDQQNERYNLETFVGGHIAIRYGEMGKDQHYIVRLDYRAAEDLIIEHQGIRPYDGDGARGMVMTADEIRKVFGNSLGERLMAAVEDPEARDESVGTLETKGMWSVIRGSDLSFGGEGMRAFYDRNLVNITNDLIKRYGSRVHRMPVFKDGDSLNSLRVQIAVQNRPRDVEAIQPEYDAAVERVAELLKAEAHQGDIEEARAEVSRLNQELADASVLRDFTEPQWGFEVTPKMAEAAKSGFALFQGGENKPRGRIDFDRDSRASIRLFEGHDLSTLLHEGGHLWLEELRADALRADASQAVKDDWATVLAWFKANGHRVTSGGAIPTEAHEMWARGMERYFMEGKAPSSALQRAFASFRSWLLRIYKVVVNLNTPLTDEVRGVMDRLLATQDAIDNAMAEDEQALLFKSAAEAGMTDAEFAAYQASALRTRSEAFDALLYRTMETIRRQRTAEWKRQSRAVRDEVQKQVEARPEFRALALLRGRGGEQVPLNRAAVVGEFGSDILALLPRGVPPTVVDQGGAHPQVLAERSGFRTAQEMVDMLVGVEKRQRELREAGDRRSVLRETVDIGVDLAMRERYGDVLNDGSIEEEALAAIHGDTRAEVIASEVRALARKSRGTGYLVPTPWQVARDYADRVVREGTVAEQASAAALARHRRNETKAARAAEKAMLAGNVDEAYRQKQSQMYHYALYRSAKAAKDQIDAVVKRLGKLAKARAMPSIDPEYLDRIHQLLEAFDFRPRSNRERAERSSFMAWAAAKEEQGEEVYIPPRLADFRSVNFKDATVEELVGLNDAVASLVHLGRRKRKLLAAKEEAELDALVAEAVARGNNLPSRKQSADRNEPRGIASVARQLDAELVKMEFIADQLDDNNPNGVFNRVLIRGATEAANVKDRLVERVLRPLADLYTGMSAAQQRRLEQKVVVPELVTRDAETGKEVPTVFSRMDILAIALNTGNESNLDKLVRGESRGLSDANAWTPEKVQAVLDREMNEADWQFVAAVWRQVETLWPDIVRSEKEITGVAPEKVEPRIVTTKFGTIQGGYYPVVYDPTRSAMAEANYDDDAAKLLGQMGRAVSTPKGHTITRTAAAAPLLLSVEGVLLNHVHRVTTRIAYGRFVRDALKFTSHPKIKDLINRKLGREYQRMVRPWLQRQVGDAAMNTQQLVALSRVLRQFRINATMVGLGFRATTMAAQTAGLAVSASELGPKYMAIGMQEAASRMGSLREFVFERSAEMATRAQTFDRDVRTFFQGIQARKQGAAARALRVVGKRTDAVRGAAFWGIGNVQLFMVDMPTWLGAYRKGLDEGMSEDEAAAYGDKVVRRTQGAGRAKDLAAIQDANEGYRVLTMFYTWFNVLYNKQRETLHAARRGDYRRAGVNVAWVMMVSPLLSALLTGDWPQDEESWGTWALRKMFFGLWLGVPGIRDVAGKIEREVSGQFTLPVTAPFFRAFDEIERPIEDAINAASGEPYSDRWLQHAITAPGYFVGLPTGQAGATAQYLYAVAGGTQHPSGPADVVAGLARGPRQDQQ